MAIKLGQMNELEVLRETDISYVLSDGNEEIFLHKREADGILKEQDRIDVFLYYDNQRRVTATMAKPKVDAYTPAFCTVVEVKHRLGVFLDIGIQKDLLLSRDDLPFQKGEWPQVGSELFIKVKVSKNQLSAKIINRYDLHNYLTPTKEFEKNDEVEAVVLFFAEEGIVLGTKEGHLIFVYNRHIREQHHLGEHLTVTITNVKVNFQYNGTLIKQKEFMMDEDGARIIKYLKEHKGMMDITDKSNPEVILNTFSMSKKAFKRAIGKLYKEKVITIHSDSIELNENPIEN